MSRSAGVHCPGARSNAAFRCRGGRFGRGYVVAITDKSDGFVGRLTLRGATGDDAAQSFVGDTCQEVVGALALVTALAVDPNALSTPPAPPAPASSQEAPTPVIAAPPKGPVVLPPWTRTLSVGGGASVTTAAAPAPLVGGSVFVEVGLERRSVWRPRCGSASSERWESRSVSPTALGRFDLTLATLYPCPLRVALDRVAFLACARLAVGALHGQGVQVAHPQGITRPWVDAGVTAGFRWAPISPAFLHLRRAGLSARTGSVSLRQSGHLDSPGPSGGCRHRRECRRVVSCDHGRQASALSLGSGEHHDEPRSHTVMPEPQLAPRGALALGATCEDAAHAEPAATQSVLSAAARTRLQAMFRQDFTFIWRVLRRLGVPPADVDDAAQQVFVVAADRIADIQAGRERAFLFGSALRVASRARQGRGPQPDSAALESQVDPGPGPEQLTDRKRALEALDAVLEAMPFELRAVFVLFELEGMSMQDIAQALDLPRGTVASRLRRAREEFHSIASRLRARAQFRGGRP